MPNAGGRLLCNLRSQSSTVGVLTARATKPTFGSAGSAGTSSSRTAYG